MENKTENSKKFWFKPKRFWGYFAAYYPVSWQGWLISIISALSLLFTFLKIDKDSHSVSDTLINFVPNVLVVLLLLDLLCFRKGEYPSWWKKHD